MVKAAASTCVLYKTRIFHDIYTLSSLSTLQPEIKREHKYDNGKSNNRAMLRIDTVTNQTLER